MLLLFRFLFSAPVMDLTSDEIFRSFLNFPLPLSILYYKLFQNLLLIVMVSKIGHGRVA